MQYNLTRGRLKKLAFTVDTPYIQFAISIIEIIITYQIECVSPLALNTEGLH